MKKMKSYGVQYFSIGNEPDLYADQKLVATGYDAKAFCQTLRTAPVGAHHERCCRQVPAVAFPQARPAPSQSFGWQTVTATQSASAQSFSTAPARQRLSASHFLGLLRPRLETASVNHA